MPERMDFLLDLLNQRPREEWKWRFEPDERKVSAINAVALCNAALLAYSPQDEVRRFLDKWGFDHATFRPLRRADTQGFVVRGPAGVIVSFRGTEPTNIADWLSDVDFHRVKSGNLPGLVHGGFAVALDAVKDDLLSAIRELAGGGQPVWITGHSLGGALAVLAAAVLKFDAGFDGIAGTYTYGQPRMSDEGFCNEFEAVLGDCLFRYVNDHDIVPHAVPEALPHLQLLRLPTLQRFSGLSFFKAPFAEITRLFGDAAGQFKDMAADETFSHIGQPKMFRADGILITDQKELDAAWKERETIVGKSLMTILSDLPSILRESLNTRVLTGAQLTDHDPRHGYLPTLALQTDDAEWKKCYPFTR
ncbi:MAG: lipase family protein [Chthoniobacteraceae bacterium]